MGASGYGYSEVVSALLEFGADVNAKNNVRNQMLMMIMIIILFTILMMMI
jgi:ankyrin repeat protein